MPKKTVKAPRKNQKPGAHAPGSSPEFRKDVLPNGIRVVTERHPASRAASCGIWVTKGTRDEAADEAGLAHFVEHLVFKRTKKRNAYEISRDMEAVGGELNAFTSREYTSFVSHSLKEDLGLSLDILSDLVCAPTFDAVDIRKEKQVVIQEIHMSEDVLEDVIFDRYLEMAYPTQSLGRPILGSEKSVAGMKRSKVVDFHGRQFVPENIIVSVTGDVDHDEVVALSNKYLKFNGRNGKRGVPAETRVGEFEAAKPFRAAIRRPSEQAHVLIGLPSHEMRSDMRFEGFIVNQLLGGGMTSKLYQTVREDRGLVYSIYSQLVTFVDAGLNLIYAGTEPKHMPTVIDLTLKELRKIRKNGISRADLNLFKTQVRGQILLGADDTESRMNSLGVNEMVFGEYRSVDDVILDIERISLDSVHEYIEKYISLDDVGILVMGAVPEGPTTKWLESL